MEKRLPKNPASKVPPIFASPMSEIDTAPRAEVDVTPNDAKVPDGSIEPHISVTSAGKCAVTKASWYPQEKKPRKIRL